MVSVGDAGVIFKAHAGTAWARFLCDPDAGSFSEFTLTYTVASVTFTSLDPASKTMVQVREDPENYDATKVA